jgi:hypothetical protein
MAQLRRNESKKTPLENVNMELGWSSTGQGALGQETFIRTRVNFGKVH